MWDPNFDPYQSILDLQIHHMNMENSIEQMTTAINHHGDILKHLSYQNHQILDLYKSIKERVTELENELIHIKNQGQ